MSEHEPLTRRPHRNIIYHNIQKHVYNLEELSTCGTWSKSLMLYSDNTKICRPGGARYHTTIENGHEVVKEVGAEKERKGEELA